MSRNDHRNRNQNHVQIQRQSVWSYPVPPPESFEKYPEDVRKVFLSEWEKQGEHRRKTELILTETKAKDVEAAIYSIKSERRHNLWALVFSFLLVLIFGCSAIYLLIIGKDIQSLGAFLGTIGIYWILKKDTNKPKS